MKHAGKARSAATKLIGASFILLLVILGAGLLGKVLGGLIWAFALPLLIIWFLFVAFTLYFFLDPTANVPQDNNAIVSPGHGTVDVIDETTVAEFAGEKCKRISIFLNVFNVHVQQ